MGGTAYCAIDTALRPTSQYVAARSNDLNVAEYQKWVAEQISPSYAGLNEDQLNLSARFPRDRDDFAARAMAQCKALDILLSDNYEEEAVNQLLLRFEKSFDHSRYMTYIFPEETALLYTIVQNEKPKRAVFMGSYYGYWAAAAKAANPALEVILCDIDGATMTLARQNFERLGLSQGVQFIVADAEVTVAALTDVDLLVLDAEGPKSDAVHEDYRDKAIYYPHLRAATSSLASGALLVAHNVILSNFTHGQYFEQKQRYYRNQYVKFLPLVQEKFVYTIIDSTEGMLVARKRQRSNPKN